MDPLTYREADILQLALSVGYVYKKETEVAIFKKLCSNSLLERMREDSHPMFMHLWEEELPYEITSKGILELNFYNKNKEKPSK